MKAKQVNRTAKWYNNPLNKKIRELLKDTGTTLDEVAQHLNVTPEAVRLWCNGYARPDIDKLPQIAKYYGVTVDWLLGLSEVKQYNESYQAIHRLTGLSESSICFLDSTKLHGFNYYLDIINLLISEAVVTGKTGPRDFGVLSLIVDYFRSDVIVEGGSVPLTDGSYITISKDQAEGVLLLDIQIALKVLKEWAVRNTDWRSPPPTDILKKKFEMIERGH